MVGAGAGLQRHGVRHIRGERALVAAHAATLIVILSEINSGIILTLGFFVLKFLLFSLVTSAVLRCW